MKKKHLSNPAALKLKMAVDYRKIMQASGQKTTLLLIADQTISELTCQVENLNPKQHRAAALSMPRPIKPVQPARPMPRPALTYDRICVVAWSVIAAVASWLVYGLITVLKP